MGRHRRSPHIDDGRRSTHRFQSWRPGTQRGLPDHDPRRPGGGSRDDSGQYPALGGRKNRGFVRRHGSDASSAWDTHRRRIHRRWNDIETRQPRHRRDDGGDAVGDDRHRTLFRRRPARSRNRRDAARIHDTVGAQVARCAHPARARCYGRDRFGFRCVVDVGSRRRNPGGR